MALDLTVGGAAADSYGSTIEADAYFSLTGRTPVWDKVKLGIGDEAALRLAMLDLENLPYMGERATAEQALEFPRRSSYSKVFPYTSVAGNNWTDLRGRAYTSDAIPAPIKSAQFEQALAVATKPAFSDETIAEKEYRTSEGRVKLKSGAELQGSITGFAWKLLEPFLKGDGQSGRSYR